MDNTERMQNGKEANVAAVAISLFVGGQMYLLMSERQYLKPGSEYLMTMPGGSKESGERLIDTGIRETLEETGLRLRKKAVRTIGKPLSISELVTIQFFCCNIDLAAPWQTIVNSEPGKHAPWRWVSQERFRKLEALGIYPNLSIHGYMEMIKQMVEDGTSLLDKYSRDDSWLGWIHEKDLRRFYGFNLSTN